MTDEESRPIEQPEEVIEHQGGEILERKLSEHLETLQVALEVAGPVLGGVAGAVTSHVLSNRPTDEGPAPEPPRTIELPSGVERDGD